MNSLITIALAATALFHTELKSSIPAKGATVASPPTISLTFTEKVVVAQSAISILHPDSSVVAKLVVKGTADDETIVAAVGQPLAPGRYLVRWKTGSTDGHVVRGTFGFTVVPGK